MSLLIPSSDANVTNCIAVMTTANDLYDQYNKNVHVDDAGQIVDCVLHAGIAHEKQYFHERPQVKLELTMGFINKRSCYTCL